MVFLLSLSENYVGKLPLLLFELKAELNRSDLCLLVISVLCFCHCICLTLPHISLIYLLLLTSPTGLFSINTEFSYFCISLFCSWYDNLNCLGIFKYIIFLFYF